MTNARLLELLDLYIESQLTDADRAELSSELARSATSCRFFWDYVHQHTMLGEVIAESAGMQLARSEQAPSLSLISSWVIVAAGILLTVGITWLCWPSVAYSSTATLAELRGKVQLKLGDDLVPAIPGQLINAGTEIHTGGNSSVVVAYPDSSRLELTADTAVRVLEETGVFLFRGEVNATVTPRPISRALTLRTEQGEVLAAGTKFRSANVDGETRIEVEEGKAVLGGRGVKAVELLTGAYALVSAPEPELYRPAPIRPLSTAAAWKIDEPSGPVMGLAISPDGRTLAIPQWFGGVRLIDLQGSRGERVLPVGEARPNVLSFSPDGRQLAVGYDPTRRTLMPLTVWDTVTGSSVHVLRSVVRKVHALGFSPDGLSLAFVTNSTQNRGVNLWDLGDSRERLRLAERIERIHCLAIHSNGKYVAIGSAEGNVLLCDSNSGRTIRTYEGHQRDVQCIAFQPNGDMLATGGRDGTIRLWSLSKGSLVRTLSGKFQEVRCLAFSPDGQTLASGHGGIAVLWDVNAGSKRSTFQAHRYAVTALAYLPDGRTLVSAGWDRCVKLWTLRPVDLQ